MSAPQILPKTDKEPILIVDREGQIGLKLQEKLKADAMVVLVSEHTAPSDVIHIPFEKKFPQVPDNNYSHTFVIDDGVNETRTSLSSFLEKAQNDNSVFIFITHMREINEKLIEDITSYYKKAKILFYGDLFGGGPIDKEADITKFIVQAKLRNKILVPGDGTETTYPVFFDDLINGILEAVFSQDDASVFYVFPKHPPTLLSLAREITKLNPHVLLDFKDEDKHKPVYIPATGKYLLDDNYPIEERLRKIKIDEKIYTDEESEKDEETEKKPFKFSKWPIFVALVLIILPLLSTLLLSFLGNISFKGAEFYIDRGDLKKAQKSAYFGRTYFDLAEKTSNLIPLIDKNYFIKDKSRIYATSFILDGLIFKDFSEFKKGLSELQKNKTDFPLSKFATATVNDWEDLLGFKGKRKYLLLLQDKNELRPGGGIIESFAVISMDKGNISNIELKDSTIPDAKAKGQVEPPFPIRRYLKSQNLKFADTSFNIDFINSASASATLLAVLENEKVDGVIAIDKSLYDELDEDWRSNKSRIKVLRKVEQAIEEKQILFAMNDQNIQNVFTANNWSSSLWDPRENHQTLINDYLGVNEANLSKNKNSQRIKRKISYNVTVSKEEDAQSSLTLSYKNETKETYKNYLRIIVPLGANIRELKINDKIIKTRSAIKDPRTYESKNFKEGSDLEIDKYIQSGKTVFGFYLEIGAEAVEEVKISYTTPQEIIMGSHLSYNLKVLKQPYNNPEFEFLFTTPADYKVTSGNKQIKMNLEKDKTIQIELSKT